MIYLDNAATSFPKAPGVADAVSYFLSDVGANSGRSSYKSAVASSRIIFECREALAELFGVTDSERIVFTSNTTESLNIAIQGMLKRGDVVLTSSIEHNSVMRPLRFLEQSKDIKVVTFKCDSDGSPDMADFILKIKENPKMLIFSVASNVNGIVLPFEEFSNIARKNGVTVCVDGAQLAGHIPLNLDSLDIDLFAFPGHKGLLGPTGIGGLYIKDGIAPTPLIFGGTGSRSEEEYQPEFMPDKYESGTPNIAGIAGLLSSVNFLLKVGIKKIEIKEHDLIQNLKSKIQSINGINIYLSNDSFRSTPIVSITHKSKSISDIAFELDQRDVATRMGLHCAPAIHKVMGTFLGGGTVRFSPGYFNTNEEIDQTVKILKEVCAK